MVLNTAEHILVERCSAADQALAMDDKTPHHLDDLRAELRSGRQATMEREPTGGTNIVELEAWVRRASGALSGGGG